MSSKALILLAIFATVPSAFTMRGDEKPFCYSPETYPTSLIPTQMEVSIPKYLGIWYEIARYGGGKQQGACICSKAQYRLMEDGKTIDVKNTCLTKDKSEITANLKAWSVTPMNNRLKVKISSVIDGNYWILDIDPSYQWVMVGEPCRDNLWILSRKPEMDRKFVNQLLEKAKAQKYVLDEVVYREDTCKIDQEIEFF